MHQIMVDLHQDHVHLARVLCVLDKQLEKIVSDQDADLFLMCDILDYIQHYPDLVHHPKEDKVYEVFKECSPVAESIVETLINEHKLLPSISKELYQTLDAAANGTIFVSREELHEKLQSFVELERAHMNLEEEKLFPLINQIMSKDDWARVDVAVQESSDPLFGDSTESCYESLYQSIKTECG